MSNDFIIEPEPIDPPPPEPDGGTRDADVGETDSPFNEDVLETGDPEGVK